MDFSHYTDEPLELATDLVNTDQRPVGGDDGLATFAELQAFLEDRADMWRGSHPEPKPDDLEPIRKLRDRLRTVFNAVGNDEAVATINQILASQRAAPRVSLHSGTPHLHFEPVGQGLPRWLGVVTAMGLATVVVEHGVNRFGSCISETCRDVFVDTSRNRSRRHCSPTCGVRENVAAYRRRRRQTK